MSKTKRVMSQSKLTSLDGRNIIKATMVVLEVFGLWSPEFNSEVKKKLYRIWIIFLIPSYTLIMVSEFIGMMLVFGDIEKMTEASFLFLTHFVEVFKMYSFFKNRKLVKEFIAGLNSNVFKPRSVKYYKYLESGMFKYNTFSIAFLLTGIATCSCWAIFPFLEKTDVRRLPLSGWFPFDVTVSPYYEIAYVYEIYGATANALVNISFDLFIAGLMAAMSNQLDVLNDMLSNINTEDFPQENRNVTTTRSREEESLLTCIKMYEAIVRFCENHGIIFSFVVLTQFGVSVIIICITLFRMSVIPLLSLQFCGIALYQVCMIVEIFISCYFGNNILIKTRQLTYSAYSCNWIPTSKGFRKRLLLFMLRTQRHVEMKAGGLFVLSLETFVVIMKSAMSYFAVLNSVTE